VKELPRLSPSPKGYVSQWPQREMRPQFRWKGATPSSTAPTVELVHAIEEASRHIDEADYGVADRFESVRSIYGIRVLDEHERKQDVDAFLDTISALRERDGAIAADLRRFRRDPTRAMIVLRAETAFLEQLLEPEDEVVDIQTYRMENWGWCMPEFNRLVHRSESAFLVRRRGPGRFKKQRQQEPAKPTETPWRQARLEARLVRILRLLRRNPDGLSANAIRKRLHLGRAETAKTLEFAVRTKKLKLDGIGNDSRYVATKRVIRKHKSICSTNG
jgi:hypothetical protein